jgi:hypothetical protein
MATNTSATPVTILFHGNCVDGWFATYISYIYLKTFSEVKMFPISPNQRNTWPCNKEISGKNILLVDVSVDITIRNEWIKNGALAIDCIDHHASAISHWPTNPDGSSTVIDIARCASLQAWMRFFPILPVPGWLQQIDRIDRWDNPTVEDRCLREVLNIISHLPVEKKISEAIKQTEDFLRMYSNPIEFQNLMIMGKQILDKKDAELFQSLQSGSIVSITTQHITGWALPNSWLGKNVYIIDNSFNPFDTTEAAHIIFCHMPHIDAFVNYRRKGFRDRITKLEKTMYVYSARSRGFDITNGTILKGHPTSAGASLIMGEVPTYPFVSPIST